MQFTFWRNLNGALLPWLLKIEELFLSALELKHIVSDKPITQPRRRSWRALELSRCFLFSIFLVIYFNSVYQTISLSPFNCKLFFKGAHMSARKTLRDRESQVTRRNLLSGFKLFLLTERQKVDLGLGYVTLP